MGANGRHGVAIIYDNTVRPDTPGEYCRRALEALDIPVSHYLPGEVDDIPPIYTLFLRVDDDLEYTIPDHLRPLAYWAIDTHRDYPRRLGYARAADLAFSAQRNGAARLRADGVEEAYWLPLACDPAFHRRIPGLAKRYDICFVGNTFPGDGDRSRLVAWIKAQYPRAFIGQAYGEEMARIYSASRLIFNCPIRDDINMRVFEAAASGALLLTRDLSANGQDLLFEPGKHLVTYRDDAELGAVITRYVADEAARERIAEAGMRHAHAHHTYTHRMADLLATVARRGDLEVKYPVIQGAAPDREDTRTLPVRQVLAVSDPAPSQGTPRASIVIPAWNQIALTRACVASIRQHTELPHEVILVDNASTDGTADWARGEGLRVIANAENLGFPRACNQGMLASSGEFIVLLNNDTLVPPRWLGRLIRHAEGERPAGLVGPSTNFGASCQQIAVPYTSVDGFLAFAEDIARRQAGQAQPVRRLVGVCLLIPRQVMQHVGLLDERFGLGMFEDDDYCLRVRLAGYPILWARDVLVHHEGHQSFRAFSEEAYRRRLEENRERFLAKWNVQAFLGEWRDELELINRLQSGRFGPWDLLRAGHYAEAYAAFERDLRAAPGEARGFVGLGLAAEGQGIPAAAALAYRTALSLAPQDPDATRGLARAAGAGGRG